MKSPISRVGIIEPDGIPNGPSTKPRRTRTTNSTGKNARAWSTTIGSLGSSRPARCARRRAKNRRSSIQTRPVAKVSTTSASSNHFIMSAHPLLVVHLEHRQERFLRDLDATDLLHPLLALLLFLEELLLAADVATVALGQHVLAQRLDVGAGDDLRADRGLDRHVELLARDQFLHLLGQLAAAALGVAAMDDD